jgi:hypothetical protein
MHEPIYRLARIVDGVNAAPPPWAPPRWKPVRLRSPFDQTQDLKRWVAAKLFVSVKRMEGKQRQHSVVHARWIAMYLCSKVLGKSSPQIGRAFNRDHTSVLHALRNIERMELDINLWEHRYIRELGG